MEEEREEEASADSVEGLNRVCARVRYLSEGLIVKLSRQENLALVRTLNLSSKTGDKQFKVISGLEKCERLQVLRLNNNLIEKMEKLQTLRQLTELHLAHNNIEKIEGLEHMACLQHLNLSYNSIQHVPVWLGKKLRSLLTINLQHNNIACLYELSRLRSLSSLSELVVSENPASSLPHSRLFLIYHIRALNRLDGLPITQEERKHAQQRFHTAELERLQAELDSSQSDVARLSREQQAVVTRLRQQEETNTTLTTRTQQQDKACTQLQHELHTKSQLLKQKTSELTRACHRHYELEQELAFYKIDNKFTPLPYYTEDQVLDSADDITESPYLGKARHTRRPIPTSSPLPLRPQTCPPQDDSSEARAEGHLQQLNRQIDEAEQQLAAVNLELKHKQEREAEKEALRQRLVSKLSVLKELREAAQETERQMDRHTEDRRQMEREIQLLQTQLHALDNTDPKHAHVTTQLANRRQLMVMMSRKQQELEGRLDDMLSRIAMETQEIKELEQQLTDGQILANEALQRDLEGIITGLQEYLGGLREQAGRAQQRAQDLESENQALQRQLQDSQMHCSQLEADNKTHSQELCRQQSDLSVLRGERQELRERQTDSSQYQIQLENQLQQNHEQSQQLREQLARTHTLHQLEQGALQAGLDNERQARENAESQLQTATDTLTHRQHILDSLQAEKAPLQQSLQTLQEELDHNGSQLNQTRSQLDQTRSQLYQTRSQLDRTRSQLKKSRSCLEQTTRSLLDPREVKGRLEHLAEALTSGQDSYSFPAQGDLLGSSLERLYSAVRHYVDQQARQEHNQLLIQNQHNQDQLAQLQAQLGRQNQSQEELERLRDRLKAAQTQIQQAKHSRRSAEHSSRAELSCQRAELECQGAELEKSRQQIQEIKEERDSLLEQLRSESSGRQQQLENLDRELQQLTRLISNSDQLTNQQLVLASEQLSALHSTVDLIDTQREQERTEGFRSQTEDVSGDLSQALQHITLLHTLLGQEKPSDEPDGSFLHRDADSVRRALEREQELTHTVEELRAALATAQQHTHTVEELRAALATAQQHTHTVEELRAALATAQQHTHTVEELRAALATAQQHTHTVEELRAALATAQQHTHTVEELRAALATAQQHTHTVEELRAALATAQQHTHTVEELRAALATAQQHTHTVEELRAALATAQQHTHTVEALRAALATAQQHTHTVEELRAALATAQQHTHTVEELRAALATAQQHTHTVEELRAALATAQQHTHTVEELRAALATAQQHTHTVEELRAALATAQQHTHTVEALRAALATAQQHTHTVEELRAALATAQQHTHTVEELRAALATAQQHTHTVEALRAALATAQQHTHTVEELRAALATAQQHIHSLTTELELLRDTRRRGQWCYVPPGHPSPSLVSQGTVDSGVGLQFPSSPYRGRHSRRPPAGKGYWVYLPPTHTHTETEWRDSGGGSEADCSSSGGVRGGGTPLSSPGPAPGLNAELADNQGPLPAPAWLLYGSPPPEAAALHCNIPQHRDMEQQGDRCDCVQRQADRQEEETRLRLKIKHLQHTLRNTHRLGAGQQCEVECLEQTLQKRRSELREADRLLLDAQTCLHTTRDKANAAQQRFSSTQSEVEEMECRAQDSASCLLEAKRQLRALEEELEEVRRNREEEKKTLREVEKVLRSRDQEYQDLLKKTHTVANRLRDVEQKECVLRSVCQAENLLEQHQENLESVKRQVEQQQQRLVEGRGEEHAVLERLDQSRTRLQEVTEGQHHQHRLLQELCVQRGEQEALLCERRSAVASLTEEAQREEHVLHTLHSEVSTHRTVLKQVLQQVLAEQQVLGEVKIKHTQSQQQLHRTLEELDRKQEEQEQKTDSYQKEVELCQKEAEQQRTELQAVQTEAEQRTAELQLLQREVERGTGEREERRRERSSLEEQCKHLEARRRHADRCVSVVELELIKLKEEQSHTHLLKQEVVRDAAATQEKLQEESGVLSLLSEQVEQRRKQLEAVEQELCVSSRALQSSKEQLQEAEQTRLQLEELQRDLTHTQGMYQSVCKEEKVWSLRLKKLTAAVTELEDRRRCLTSQQERLAQLSQELQHKEEGLQHKEEGLDQKEAELERRWFEHSSEENGEKLTLQRVTELQQELINTTRELDCLKDKLCVQEQTEVTEIREAMKSLHSDIRKGLDNLDTPLSDQDTPLGNREIWEMEEEEPLSVSMAGLRSAFNTADERWRGELRRDGLRQQEHHLKARLREAVWSQQDSLSQSRLKTEDCLLGLKQRLDQLDLLLTHTP